MKKKGIGYACMIYGTGYGNGFPDESRATIELLEDGLVMVSVEATDVGQGAKNVMKQIAAETLEIPIDLVAVQNSDSAKMEDSGTAAASRQTYNTGNAVMDGCNNFKRQFFDPYIKKDKIKKEKNYSTILRWLYKRLNEDGIEVKTTGYFKANTSSVNLETGQGNPYWPYTFSVNRAVVEVDDETGKVDVLEIAACHDSGKIINPIMAQGQIEGGCAMGLGYALMEKVEFNEGCIKNPNFADYIIPTSIDVPKIKTYFIEEDEVTGPYGAKGLGEPSMISTAPAILNAINDAVGVRILDLPATCDKVLLAIKNKEKSNG